MDKVQEQTDKPERHLTLLQKQHSVAKTALRASYLYFVACTKHQAIWKLGVGEPPIHPTNLIEDE